MTTKPQQNKQTNNTLNKPARCIVCGGLTPVLAYVDDKFQPCHIGCYDVLRQRGSQELEVTPSVV